MSLIKINQRSANTLIGTNRDSRFDTIMAATGGTVTTDGDFKVHTFTSSGDFVVSSVEGLGEARILLVGGGGGGGYIAGGGGGGGGFYEETHVLSTGTYVVTIASGGSGRSASNSSGGMGGNSLFNPTAPATVDGEDITLKGFGGGTSGPGGSGSYTGTWYPNNYSHAGGSSAGAPGITANPNRHTIMGIFSGQAGIQGTAGGQGVNYGDSGSFIGGGGGGGAQNPGVSPPQGSGPIGARGPGGDGKQTTITGAVTTYGGGGGGGYAAWANTSGASGGAGGGGIGGTSGSGGVSATAGTANTGGGGGGGAYADRPNGANGGSGIVIIRYRFQQEQLIWHILQKQIVTVLLRT